MKIKFHQILAFFIVTLFLDLDYDLSFIRLRLMDFFLVGVIVTAILSLRGFKIVSTRTVVSFFIFIFFIIINGITKVKFGDVFKEGIQLIEYLFLMHLIINATSESQKREEFLNVLFWGTGAVAVFSMLYHISHGVYAGYKDLDAPKHSFAFFALLAIVRYFTSIKKDKSFQLMLVLFSITMVLLSGERKGWMGLFAGVSFFIFLQLRHSFSKKTVRILFSFAIVIFFIATVALIVINTLPQFHYFSKQLDSLTAIFAGEDDAEQTRSNEVRIFMINFGLALFLKYPWFGIGIDQFNDFITKATKGAITHDAHNFYLKILVENGVAGFILFIAFNFIFFRDLWKTSKTKIRQKAITSHLLVAIFLLGAVVNMFLASKALTWLYIILPLGMMIGLNKEYAQVKKLKREFAQ